MGECVAGLVVCLAVAFGHVSDCVEASVDQCSFLYIFVYSCMHD